MAARLRAVAIALLSSFALLAAVQGYWQVIAAHTLVGAPFDRHDELLGRITKPGVVKSSDGQLILGPVRTNGGWAVRYYMAQPFAHITGFNARTGLQKKLAAALYGKGRYADFRYQLLHGRPRGCDVTLTINASLQEQAVRVLGGRPGCALVVRVSDGALLAAASSPTFDCVQISADRTAYEIAATDPEEPLVFKPLQKLYEPGWAMAWVTAAAALESGAGDEKFFCDGEWRVKTLLVECPRRHGYLTVLDALARHCRVCVAKCADHIGADAFRSIVKALHLLDRAAVPLDSAQGRMPDLYNWRARRNLIEAALGMRETRLTPLALARFFLAVARGGQVLQPYMIARIVKPSGGEVHVGRPKELGSAFSQATAQRLLQVMAQLAAEPDVSADLSGLDVAACAWWHGRVGHHIRKGTAWFAALQPADHPRVLVLTVVERVPDAEAAVSAGADLLHYAAGIASSW